MQIFNICVTPTEWILSCSLSEISESIIMKRLTWKSSATFWSCHHKKSHSNSHWRHGHYCSTGVLLLGLQVCCTSFHEIYDKKVIDINAMALKLGNKYFYLLTVHALSGCESMSYPCEKWKISALNLLLKLDLNLQVFTEPDAEEVDWMKAGIDSLLLVLQKVNGISEQFEIHII